MRKVKEKEKAAEEKAAAAAVETAAEKAAAEKAETPAVEKAAVEKAAAPPPVAALTETLPPSKWLGQKVEAQACTPDVCDFMCGECEWEPCEVNAPHTHSSFCISSPLLSYPLLPSDLLSNSTPGHC